MKSIRRRNIVPGLETPELNYNHLTDALLDVPSIREMYLRRLKTVVDNYIATDYLKDAVKRYYKQIQEVAKRDHSRWRTGDIYEGYTQLITEQLPKRKKQLLKTYAAHGSDPLLPLSQDLNATVELKEMYIPLNGEYRLSLEIFNPNTEAVDISGWTITNSANITHVKGLDMSLPYCNDYQPKNGYSCEDIVSWNKCGAKNILKKGICRKSCGHCRIDEGPMRFLFKPGTVIPGMSGIYITDDSLAYKKSLIQYKLSRFVVGPLDGKLTKDLSLKVFDNKNILKAEKSP